MGFMASTRDDGAKRGCYKILSDLPQGDTKALMTKISSIEAFPDNKSVSVKPIINKDEIKRKVCNECKFKGHLAPDCWGKCQHCGRYGHKSQVCRTRPQQAQPEPVKKTSDDKKKRKFKKKKVKKENAKWVVELQDIVQSLTLNTPVISSGDEISCSDSESSSQSQAVMRVQVQQPQAPLTRREQRANLYAGLISDKKVIDSLNCTKMASIIKIKKAKTTKGMSYTDGKVSNCTD